MSFDTSIAGNIQSQVESLIELVSDDRSSQAQTAYEVESHLWQSLLVMGQQLMQLFFNSREADEERQKAYEVDGMAYPYRGQRKRHDVSLFGEVTVGRAYYWDKGKEGRFPLDEQLSLPERSFSDLVQERVSEMTVMMSYEETTRLFSKWFGWDLHKRPSQQINADHAEDVSIYYEARSTLETPAQDTILVVSADGKGIPMTRQDSPPPEARRGRGQKKTAKKEATVTALYTIEPYRRDPQDIIRALVPDGSYDATPQAPRPKPTHKQLSGTLAGQTLAFEQVAQQVAQRDTDGIRHYVALTDGNRGLKKRVQEDLPHFTLIVDIIHVTEYLWDAANVLLGETHPLRTGWIQDALRCVLDDDLDQLLKHLHYQMPTLAKSKQTTLQKVIRYLNNNREYMHYHDYLAQGYPIGTGVIEGACRHLVKDRFERSGMRWSRDGTQVMLDLRAVYLNGDWDDFQRFRRQHAHQKRYDSSYPNVIPEELMLDVAA